MKDPAIPDQYYKDVLTGIEMNFSFDTKRGWMVSFPHKQPEYLSEISYPETPEKYKAQIEQFYKDLEEKYQMWGKENVEK